MNRKKSYYFLSEAIRRALEELERGNALNAAVLLTEAQRGLPLSLPPEPLRFPESGAFCDEANDCAVSTGSSPDAAPPR